MTFIFVFFSSAWQTVLLILSFVCTFACIEFRVSAGDMTFCFGAHAPYAHCLLCFHFFPMAGFLESGSRATWPVFRLPWALSAAAGPHSARAPPPQGEQGESGSRFASAVWPHPWALSVCSVSPASMV